MVLFSFQKLTQIHAMAGVKRSMLLLFLNKKNKGKSLGSDRGKSLSSNKGKTLGSNKGKSLSSNKCN